MVQKGDTLVQLTLESLHTDQATNKSLALDLQSRISDLSQATAGTGNALNTPEIQQEWQTYSSKKQEMQNKIDQTQMGYNRNKGLFDKGIIARVEFEKYNYDYTFAQQEMTSLVKSQRSSWQSQKRELENQLKNLNGTLQKLAIDSKNYVITAPLSGTIENFSGIQVGSFLNASQPIANLSATDQLIVESTVSPNDIGLIHKNQKVKFQIDAFNYNQWGLLEGNVIDIDHNITIQGDQSFFKVRCSLNSTEMKLKSGYTTKVSKGMTLTSRYVITRRSLFDLLFDKMDDWLNPKIIRN